MTLQIRLFSILRIHCCMEHGVAHYVLRDHRLGCNVITGVLSRKYQCLASATLGGGRITCCLSPNNKVLKYTLLLRGRDSSLEQGAKVTMRLNTRCKNRQGWF